MNKRMVSIAVGTVFFATAATALFFGIYLLPATAWRNISIWLIIIGVLLALIGLRLFTKSDERHKRKGDIRIVYRDPNMNKLAQSRRQSAARAYRGSHSSYRRPVYRGGSKK